MLLTDSVSKSSHIISYLTIILCNLPLLFCNIVTLLSRIKLNVQYNVHFVCVEKGH